ncbi:MAG: hypothetical protein Q8N81_05055, partial [bacterium]|nr:hypothetical protein [bacterium]
VPILLKIRIIFNKIEDPRFSSAKIGTGKRASEQSRYHLEVEPLSDRAKLGVPFRHSNEQIAWSIFDIISLHQKLNLRDEIA